MNEERVDEERVNEKNKDGLGVFRASGCARAWEVRVLSAVRGRYGDESIRG